MHQVYEENSLGDTDDDPNRTQVLHTKLQEPDMIRQTNVE